MGKKETKKSDKASAEATIKTIRRKTRRNYSAEQKIRIVLEGLRGDDTIAELCRREGIVQSLYYKWSKDFMEAGKSRLAGDSKREASSEDVTELRSENEQLKQVVAELVLKNRVLKKKSDRFGERVGRMSRYTQSEKLEIIRIVEASELSVKQTLIELDVPRSTFYDWYRRYLADGRGGLADRNPQRQQFWNQIPDQIREHVVDVALEHTGMSPRQLAWHITDTEGYFISESSVYRILKSYDLVTSPAFELVSAKDEFEHKTRRINEMWQTDFTQFKVIDWGYYYLCTILDDYSRYILAWRLAPTMGSTDVEETLNLAMTKTKLTHIKVKHRPRLLSDNGPAFISDALKRFLSKYKMTHVRGAPYHPQTQGKIERYHRSMKSIVKLDNYYSPGDLEQALVDFVCYYNTQRYHELLENVTPDDVYHGRQQQILTQRELIKQQTLQLRRQDYLQQVAIVG